MRAHRILCLFFIALIGLAYPKPGWSRDFSGMHGLVRTLATIEFQKQPVADEFDWRELYIPEMVDGLSGVFSDSSVFAGESSWSYFNDLSIILPRIRRLYPKVTAVILQDLLGSQMLNLSQTARDRLKKDLVIQRDAGFHWELLRVLVFRMPDLVQQGVLGEFLRIWSIDAFHKAAHTHLPGYSKYSLVRSIITFYRQHRISYGDFDTIPEVVALIAQRLGQDLWEKALIGPSKHIFIYSYNGSWFLRQSQQLKTFAQQRGAQVRLSANIEELRLHIQQAKETGVAARDIAVIFATHGDKSRQAFEGNHQKYIAAPDVAKMLLALGDEEHDLDGLIFLTSACYGYELTTLITRALQQYGVRHLPIMITQSNEGRRTWSGYVTALIRDYAHKGKVTIGDYLNVGERLNLTSAGAWRFNDPTLQAPVDRSFQQKILHVMNIPADNILNKSLMIQVF